MVNFFKNFSIMVIFLRNIKINSFIASSLLSFTAGFAEMSFSAVSMIFWCYSTPSELFRSSVFRTQAAMGTAKMPNIIYGTAWKKERTCDLVVAAVRAGFRGIDTACQPKHYYEPGVGQALQRLAAEDGIKREEIFIQTKFTPIRGQDPKNVPYDTKAPLATQVQQSLEASLRNLQTTYIDSLVLHSPLDTHQNTMVVWREFEGFVRQVVAMRSARTENANAHTPTPASRPPPPPTSRARRARCGSSASPTTTTSPPSAPSTPRPTSSPQSSRTGPAPLPPHPRGAASPPSKPSLHSRAADSPLSRPDRPGRSTWDGCVTHGRAERALTRPPTRQVLPGHGLRRGPEGLLPQQRRASLALALAPSLRSTPPPPKSAQNNRRSLPSFEGIARWLPSNRTVRSRVRSSPVHQQPPAQRRRFRAGEPAASSARACRRRGGRDGL